MDFNLDNHKLGLHPYEVGRWLRGDAIFPISAEVSPSGSCNHRCDFCSQSYLGYKKRYLESTRLIDCFKEMRKGGTKSVVFAGEGEPLLHPHIADMVGLTHEMGLDCAISTNAVLLSKHIAYELLPNLTWIRISLNATDKDMYAKVHGTIPCDFDKVICHISEAVEVKKRRRLDVTIGVQYVLYEDNANFEGITQIARLLKRLGTDYFSVKPYSRHPLSKQNVKAIDYMSFQNFYHALSDLNAQDFCVIIRNNAMSKIGKPKSYVKCLGLPFWAYIDSGLQLWPCLAFIGAPEYKLGDLSKSSYTEIINSDRYRKVMEHMGSMDVSACRESCRLESINEYLCNLTKEASHRNFI